jgi:hypothetical protein
MHYIIMHVSGSEFQIGCPRAADAFSGLNSKEPKQTQESLGMRKKGMSMDKNTTG